MSKPIKPADNEVLRTMHNIPINNVRNEDIITEWDCSHLYTEQRKL